MTEGSHIIKLPFQQKSRSPHHASLCACNKAATTFENNMRLWFITVAAALLHARNETWCGSLAFLFGQSDFISLDFRGAFFTGFIALCACNAHLTPFGLQWRSGAMSILVRAATAPGLHCARSLRLCCTRAMKLGADRGFFVDRAALFL